MSASFDQQNTVVVTADVARERAFFVEAFGYEVALDIGWFVSLREPKSGGTLDLWSDAHDSTSQLPKGPSAGFVLAYVVADLAVAEERALAAGATPLQAVRDEPWGQRHVLLRAPSGTVLDLVQRIPPDPQWLAANGLG